MSKVFFLIFTVIVVIGFSYLFLEVQNLKNAKQELPLSDSAILQTVQTENKTPDYTDLIKQEVAKAVANLPSPQPVVTKTVTQAAPKSQQTSYIPLSGPISTTSTEWFDAPGTESFIDVANDYGKESYITWEATLKIANASGSVLARLFDVTHGIAVNGSEVSVGSSSYSTVSSAKLSLWAGKNKYIVQIKSQTSQEATFGSGRIKVSY